MPTFEANATTKRFLNEQVRPLAEIARKVYASGLAISVTLPTLLDELLAAQVLTINEQGQIVAPEPGTVLEDGRANEGITQITAGDLAAILNTLGGVVQTIAAEPGIQAALERASVRKLTQAD